MLPRPSIALLEAEFSASVTSGANFEVKDLNQVRITSPSPDAMVTTVNNQRS
jgi:hypothetical protein